MALSKTRIKLTLKLFFVAFFIQSAVRLYASCRDAVMLRQNEALENPIESIVPILRFATSVILFPALFLALERGLKYLLIICIDWLVVLSSFDAYTSFYTTTEFLGVLREESMQDNAKAITNTMVSTLFTSAYELANISARAYILTTLVVRYHSMHRQVELPSAQPSSSKGSSG
ncbi:uncharacterized protein LOC135368677 [Ornithodoros turicata]|uniref:uncharacterized protein LOC135368677 n=1 Tax=Ornithodoros turicata TaxID=34597 RepID=UPI003138AFC6